MTTYIIRRLLHAVIVLILVSILIFLAIRFLPGNPVLMYMTSGYITTEHQAILMKQFGLDKPMYLQYIYWIGNLCIGDFGISFNSSVPVRDLLFECIPVTLCLGGISFILSSILGIGFGLISAIRRGTWLDNMATSMANFGVAVPGFWLGILMIYFLGLRLGWLPVFGFTSPFQDFSLSCKQLVMPIFVLVTFSMAFLARQTRSSTLEVIKQDYIRTAMSKGLSERVVIMRHALKNGLIPVVTVMGMGLGHLLGGSVVVENVFGIPGVGRLMVVSVMARDYNVVQACVLLIAAAVVLINLFIDLLYGWLDPRIRYD
jgi:peptide/nickel transport system permease protein